MTAIAKRPNDLTAIDTETLKAELAASLRTTAQGLVRMAAIVAELQTRGEDLSDLRLGLVTWLRKIASGQVLPEIVVRYQGSPQLLRSISALPLNDQQRFADGEPVKLIVDLSGDHRLVEPLKLTREQLHQVFAADHVRDDTEQIMVMETRRNRPAKPETKSRRVRGDKDAGGIFVGRAFAEHGDVLAALADLASPERPDSGDRNQPVNAPLTEAEHRKLSVAAANAGISRSELMRRALRAMGLI